VELESRAWTADDGWSAPLPHASDGPATVVVAFGATAVADAAAPLDELRKAFPTSHVVGCSTAGEILGERLADNSVVVSIARFERARIASTLAHVAGPHESYDAGQAIGRALASPDLRAVLVLSDGLLVNGSQLVRGLTRSVASDVVITGGLAGDGECFERTWVLADGVAESGVIAAIGFAGAARVGAGSAGGWDIFGPERTITSSDGNVLYELDGRPALELYREYLGDRADGLPATAMLFPLAIRPRRDETPRTVRTVLAIDESEQSMTFAGDVSQGWHAQLMCANRERLVDGAMQAASRSALPAEVAPQLAVAISCVGRRLVLGERTEEEIEATLEALAPGAELVGFYSYGEIGPHAEGFCDLHNQTMTVTTIGER
jgi:hypothetical protein